MSPLVVIAGPTASGKSALAMQIARQFDGEIICADSRTVYKGMDIGTAKPTAADQKQVKHHLIDVVTPDQPFTAVEFKKLANKAIADITKRGKLAIMVGGTGLYVDAVIFDYQFGAPADPNRREELQQMDIEQLQRMCHENGVPLPANSQNKRHLIRALEIGGLSQMDKKLRTDTLVVALTTDREVLRGRIKARAQEMVERRVLHEVKTLSDTYGWDNEAMTGNIYRMFKPVIEGSLSLPEALEQFVTSDMQLAKRQVTWLKRNPFVIWGTADQLKIAIEHFVQQNKLLKSIPA